MNKKLRIVHKDGVTNVYDGDGQDLTKQMWITEMQVDFTAGERVPKIHLTLFGPDVELEIDEAEVDVKREEQYSF